MGWVDLIGWYLSSNAGVAHLFCEMEKVPEKMTRWGCYCQTGANLPDNAYRPSAIMAFKSDLVQISPTFAGLQPEAPGEFFLTIH
jgi:hypothetical protein